MPFEGDASPPSKSKKVIRSFSIDEATLNRLHAVANERKISVNALLMEVIDYYLEIGVHSGDIGLLQIAIPYFRIILETCNPEELYSKASIHSRKAFEEWAELRNLKRDLPSFLNMVRYHEPSGWAKIKIVEAPRGAKILFIHNLGETWSRFIEAWFSGGYEFMVGKKLPEGAFERVDNGIVLTLS